MAHNIISLNELPFHDLNLDELLKEMGSWVYSSINRLLDKKDLFKDTIESPNGENDHYEHYIESKYYSIKQTGMHFDEARKKNGFSVFHCNMRSLSKNVSLLEDILLTVKETPNVIAISETKLNDYSRQNVNIPGYTFLNTNSKTAAGGVGLYVSEDLEFVSRRDLDLCMDGVECCWIELSRKRQKSILIGCVYRHPSGDRDLFSETLKSQLERLNNKGYEIIVLGDININFLNYNNDNHTSDFLDMLLDLGFMPLITKATRITDHTSTLIDHIYTNMPGKTITAGICLADVSDHLPIFCTIANKLSTSTEIKYFRDYSKFDNEAFLNSLASIDFRSLVTCDVNASMNRVTQILQQISDEHAPVRRASRQKRKQLNKPWISNAILTCIKKKNSLRLIF